MDLFLQKKSSKALLCLMDKEKCSISELSSKINSPYAHTFNLIRKFEEIGIIYTKKEGRTKFVFLTPKGKRAAYFLKSFIDSINSESVGKNKKLLRYLENLKRYLIDLKSSNHGKIKYARIAGRYKKLLRKTKPRNEEDKKIKKEALEILKQIEELIQ
ncbi:MAG: hypothetical protein DRN25_02530 [Thermoplasmata archaeon]|nr:MAG: hypothetical protein DRN25_02530 [Thermoplasmata archaeon]